MPETLFLWRKARRVAMALVAGLILSVAYNAAVWFLIGSIDPNTEGFLAHVLLAPGILLAGRGFEEQTAIIPLNVIVFFLAFTVVSWVLLSRRARRRLKSFRSAAVGRKR